MIRNRFQSGAIHDRCSREKLGQFFRSFFVETQLYSGRIAIVEDLNDR